MSTDTVIMNTGTKVNFSKVEKVLANEYFEKTAYIVRTTKGTDIAVLDWEGVDTDLTTQTWNITLDSGRGNRHYGRGTVVGIIEKDHENQGQVPTKAIPVYVFK